MYRYEIKCTEEQTRKALELGAPIKCSPITINCERFNLLKDENYFHGTIPTAEQMIGWLEEQGFYIRLNTSGCSVEIDFACILELIGISRKKATLAAIDAALDYLIEKKGE